MNRTDRTLSPSAVSLLREISHAIRSQFDHPCILPFIETSRASSDMFRRIRHCLYRQDLQLLEAYEARDLEKDLDRFVRLLERDVLPSIRSRLGVSSFGSARSGLDQEAYIRKRFFVEVLPHNLSALSLLGDRLRSALATSPETALIA